VTLPVLRHRLGMNQARLREMITALKMTLGCDAVLSGRLLPMFQRNLLPPSLESELLYLEVRGRRFR
jgi:hypothetical protein